MMFTAIISIFFEHMGMEKDLVRKILVFDNELDFQTMCLREEGDCPFEPPNRLVETEKCKE